MDHKGFGQINGAGMQLEAKVFPLSFLRPKMGAQNAGYQKMYLNGSS